MIQRCIFGWVSLTAEKCVMLNQIYKEMESPGYYLLCLAIEEGAAINTVLFKHFIMIRTGRF